MRYTVLSWLVTGTVVLAACGKKKSEETTTTTPTLVSQIDLNCSSSTTTSTNCFDNSTSLSIVGTSGPLDTMLMFTQIIVGFPSATTYNSLMTTDTTKEIAPQTGLAGRLETIRKTIATEAGIQGIASCSAVPTSGQFTASDGSSTIEWTTPKLAAPASYPKSGTYEKALIYTTKSTTTSLTHVIRFEFFCDYSGSAAVTDVRNASGTTVFKHAFYYDRSTSTKIYADLFMYDSGTINTNPLELAFQMRTTSATEVQAWVTRTGIGSSTGTSLGYRYAVNADLTTKKVSLFSAEAGTSATMTDATWSANSVITSEAVTATTAPASGSNNTDGTWGPVLGCGSSWNAASSSMTTAAGCSGLDLSKAPAPALDTTGNMSLQWVRANVATKVKAL